MPESQEISSMSPSVAYSLSCTSSYPEVKSTTTFGYTTCLFDSFSRVSADDSSAKTSFQLVYCWQAGEEEEIMSAEVLIK